MPDLDELAARGCLTVGELAAKHIPQDMDDRAGACFVRLAEQIGYEFPRIGTHQGLSQDEDIARVRRMARAVEVRPLKIVLTSDGRAWADNTHWALAAMVRHGMGVLVRDTPHYLVDVSVGRPRVIGKPAGLEGPALERAILNALRVEQRVSRGWRPLGCEFLMRDLFEYGRYDGG